MQPGQLLWVDNFQPSLTIPDATVLAVPDCAEVIDHARGGMLFAYQFRGMQPHRMYLS